MSFSIEDKLPDISAAILFLNDKKTPIHSCYKVNDFFQHFFFFRPEKLPKHFKYKYPSSLSITDTKATYTTQYYYGGQHYKGYDCSVRTYADYEAGGLAFNNCGTTKNTDAIPVFFKIECDQNREVLTFGRRQDMDTFVGFEIMNGKVAENVIVFHPSFGQNFKGWNIIESEHSYFFDFMQKRVLTEMKEWIHLDDVNDYI